MGILTKKKYQTRETERENERKRKRQKETNPSNIQPGSAFIFIIDSYYGRLGTKAVDLLLRTYSIHPASTYGPLTGSPSIIAFVDASFKPRCRNGLVRLSALLHFLLLNHTVPLSFTLTLTFLHTHTSSFSVFSSNNLFPGDKKLRLSPRACCVPLVVWGCPAQWYQPRVLSWSILDSSHYLDRSKMPGPGGGPSRKSHTKSRNGCKTCKRRHIRCDESFPQWYAD